MSKSYFKYMVKWISEPDLKSHISSGYCFGETMAIAISKLESFYGKYNIDSVYLKEVGADFDDVLETSSDGEEMKKWYY